jgi:hypothetical protein
MQTDTPPHKKKVGGQKAEKMGGTPCSNLWGWGLTWIEPTTNTIASFSNILTVSPDKLPYRNLEHEMP